MRIYSRLLRLSLLAVAFIILLGLQPQGHAQVEPNTSRIYYVEASVPQPISDVYGFYNYIDIVNGEAINTGRLFDFGIGGVTVLPQWSPNGEQMVFAHKPPYLYSASGYIADQVTGYSLMDGLREVLMPRQFIAELIWSPDGTQLAFYSGTVNDAPVFQLEIMDGDGSSRHLFEGVRVDYPTNMTWSPDGTQLAFLSRVDNLRSTLQMIHLATATIHETTAVQLSPFDTYPQWTPDGRTILLGNAFIYDIAEDHFDELAINTGGMVMLSNPILSPDGTRIAAITLDDGLVVWDYMSGQVLARIPIGRYAPDYGNPVWSPDSTHVALSTISDRSEFAQIYIADIANETLQQATFVPDMHAIAPQWRPYTSQQASN